MTLILNAVDMSKWMRTSAEMCVTFCQAELLAFVQASCKNSVTSYPVCNITFSQCDFKNQRKKEKGPRSSFIFKIPPFF